MKNIDYEILQDIITDHELCHVQKEELIKVINKLIPYKIEYKNGFGFCKCGNEFENEGYPSKEICSECGQIVWVSGYNNKENNNVLFFKTR